MTNESIVVGRLTLPDPASLNARGRRELSKWLRGLAEDFDEDTSRYAKRFIARLYLPPNHLKKQSA